MSHFGNFAPPEAENRLAHRRRLPGYKHYHRVAACGHRIGMCGYSPSPKTGVFVLQCEYFKIVRVLDLRLQMLETDSRNWIGCVLQLSVGIFNQK